MLKFLKRHHRPQKDAKALDANGNVLSSSKITATKPGVFKRLVSSLGKTKKKLSHDIATTLLGKKNIDAKWLEQIETPLLMADVGVETTTFFIDRLKKRLSYQAFKEGVQALLALKQDMTTLLASVEQPLVIDTCKQPFVIVVVGINGVGKTTTIGKLAKRLQCQGKKVMLAAGDTFRAAAVEQLQIWGKRNAIPVVAQQQGADSAAVIFDAMESAKRRGIDVLIADTAGRLHTQSHLMAELQKVYRVIAKKDDSAPHETLLVLDATNGQNGLIQAQQFYSAIGVSGICLTKLDSSAKGGIIFAVAHQLNLPIRFVGIGEGIDDLQDFNASVFVDALFASQ